MWRAVSDIQVMIGGNTYIRIPTLVAYKNQPLLEIRRRDADGRLEINLVIFDSQGQPLAFIQNDRILQEGDAAFRITQTLVQYAVEEIHTGRLVLDVQKSLENPARALSVHAELYTPDGFLFIATPQKTNLRGYKLKNQTFHNGTVGITIMEKGRVGIG